MNPNQKSGQGNKQSGSASKQSGSQGSGSGTSESGSASTGIQGGSPEQHAEAGRQSHKNDK